MKAMGWYAGFVGPDPEYGRLIGKVESWGHGYENVNWIEASACRSANLPQIRLEPIMKARAEELNPGRARFHHELAALSQDADGLDVRVTNHNTGEEYEVRAKYVIGCDGGRTVGKLVGIDFEGLGVIAHSTTAHVSADLSKLARDPDVLIRWIWCPALGEMAVLVPMGPERWGPDSEEWVFHVSHQGEDVKAITDVQVEKNMRLALGLGDMPIKIYKITRWAIEGVLATKFREGRVFVLGDAAHRHPPTGGLGLTSAIQDAQNLCWKLAAALEGAGGRGSAHHLRGRTQAGRRRQHSTFNGKRDHALRNGTRIRIESARLARNKLGAAEEGRQWQAGGRGASLASATRRAARQHGGQRTQRRVRLSLCVQGDRCRRLARACSDRRHKLYEPSTRPGSPLPHAWDYDESGYRRALKDLVAPGRFLLIAGEEGQAWTDAAGAVAAANDLPIDALRIGHIDGDLFDPRLAWARYRGISEKGAVLVRPGPRHRVAKRGRSRGACRCDRRGAGSCAPPPRARVDLTDRETISHRNDNGRSLVKRP